jgi:hypothetical protein
MARTQWDRSEWLASLPAPLPANESPLLDMEDSGVSLAGSAVGSEAARGRRSSVAGSSSGKTGLTKKEWAFGHLRSTMPRRLRALAELDPPMLVTLLEPGVLMQTLEAVFHAKRAADAEDVAQGRSPQVSQADDQAPSSTVHVQSALLGCAWGGRTSAK